MIKEENVVFLVHLEGFLTDDLVNHSETSSSTANTSNQMTYFGVCRLSEPESLVNTTLLINIHFFVLNYVASSN